MARQLRLNTRRMTAPRIHNGTVDRTRLTGLSHRLPGHQLVLVHAPAGSGKTTLLGQWHEMLQQAGAWAAWYSASETERDRINLADSLLLAIQNDKARTPGSGIDIAPFSDSNEAIERLVAQLKLSTEAREPVDRHLILFIDDFHLIDGEAEAATINALLSAFAETLTLVLASRIRPALPLGRLRARGELLELAVSDLQFSVSETRSFFRSALGLELSMEESAQLHGTTEGWAAGLRLASLVPSGLSNNFWQGAPAGSQRAFAEYFLDEVFAGLPDDAIRFLECTSILDSLTPDLCDALMQEPGSAAVLERIERSQLFITELHGRQRWYKYHHLFQEFLQARLQTHGPEMIIGLHERACEWFITANLPIEAVHHAFQARMPERAAELIERYCTYDYLSFGRFETYYRWMTQLPKEYREARPLLMFLLIWRYINTRQFLKAEQTLGVIETAARNPASTASRIARETGIDIAGRLDLMRALIGAYDGNLARARHHCNKLEERPLDQLAFGLVDYHSIRSYVAYNDGDLDLAERLTWRANAAYEEIACHWGKIHSQCIAVMSYIARGRLSDAAQVLSGTLESARIHFSDQSYMVALPAVLDGLLAYNQGNLERAENLWVSALSRSGHGLATGLTERQEIAICGLVRAYDATGRSQEASALLLTYSRRAFETEDFRLEFRLNIELADRAFKLGNLLEARRYFERVMTRHPEALARFPASAWQVWEPFGLMEVREKIAVQASTEAIMILDRLAQSARAQDRICSALCCEAFAARVEGQTETSFASIRDNARGIGMLRLFDDFADRVPIGGTYHVTQAMPQNPANQTELTAREQEVLALLQHGLSNTEIVDVLGIKMNTVKSHLKNLFSKLGVRSRAQAMAKTRSIRD